MRNKTSHRGMTSETADDNILSPSCSNHCSTDGTKPALFCHALVAVLCLGLSDSFLSERCGCLQGFRSGSLAKIGVTAFVSEAIIRKSNGQIATCTAWLNLSFDISVSVGVVQPFGLVLEIQKWNRNTHKEY
ncbi:hypothetical protein CEXT_73281 [Caerostris extrusa]|uniref:Uncharacterized protein n=1 Tax=Caerostris extrusa TaxID=172846 RepID=A0AAV4XK75_CAEEX|nr:hypothetical protein CEXT_73281 [Caerostris extrusa]